jgi:hypothetical protein
MLPKCHQPYAPCPTASGNMFQAPVDPPHNGNNLPFNRGDERTNGSNDNTIVNMYPGDSGANLALIHCIFMALIGITIPIIHLVDSYNRNDLYMYKLNYQLMAISSSKTKPHNNNRVHSNDCFEVLESKMDSLLQKIDMTWIENTTLREAYYTSREETAMLKAAVETLMKKLNESTTMSAPPSLGTITTCATMEEMSIQLPDIQNNIQNILDTVCNPPGKRKQYASSQDNEPTMPMNR